MALILFEGFEDLGAWTVGGTSAVSASGRNGNAVQFLNGVSNNINRVCVTADEHATFIAGCAFKYTTMPTTANSSIVLGFLGDAGATTHTVVTVESDGTLRAARGTTALQNSPAATIAINTWYYLEFKAVLHDTTGSWLVRLNGTNVLSGSGDTKNAGTKTVYDTLKLGAVNNNSGVLLVDDLYWLNGAGSTSNDVLGDLAVETLYPDGTDTQAWSGSDGNTIDNHLLVDETGAPSMTDYVSSATVAARELYTFGDLVRTGGTVHGVTAVAYANKSDSAARGLKLAIKEGGGAQRQSADMALSTTPVSYVASWDRKNDASAWSVSDVNALKAGVEVGS